MTIEELTRRVSLKIDEATEVGQETIVEDTEIVRLLVTAARQVVLAAPQFLVNRMGSGYTSEALGSLQQVEIELGGVEGTLITVPDDLVRVLELKVSGHIVPTRHEAVITDESSLYFEFLRGNAVATAKDPLVFLTLRAPMTSESSARVSALAIFPRGTVTELQLIQEEHCEPVDMPERLVEPMIYVAASRAILPRDELLAREIARAGMQLLASEQESVASQRRASSRPKRKSVPLG